MSLYAWEVVGWGWFLDRGWAEETLWLFGYPLTTPLNVLYSNNACPLPTRQEPL
jgi:hypothetical protein